MDSDGTDGPTDMAGGLIDNLLLEEAKDSNINLSEDLKVHNSREALAKLSGLIRRHAGTDLNSLRVVLTP